QYEDSENAPTKAGQELAIRGAVQPWQPNAGVPLGPNHVNHVLAQFVADATAGTLPQVSWIVAPYEYSEHPAASQKNEFIDGQPIGFGSRVPMIIASPWTRGGYVDSNTYNHTSMLQFLETWTGVRAHNITDWRRSVAG